MKQDFLPIGSYGFIGNLSSCALVSRTGSIDWCCLPKTDSPSIFGAILDPEKAGSFLVEPADEYERSFQSYEPNTNVLKTTFVCKGGTLEVLDWMHMGGFTFEEQNQHRLSAIYRLVRCTEGGVKVRMFFDPQFDYARDTTTIYRARSGIVAEGTHDTIRLFADCTFSILERGAEAKLSLRANEEVPLICSYGNTQRSELPPVHRSLERTIRYWERWSQECETQLQFPSPSWSEAVMRSALVLKILAGGNGIAAAATTSLPEVLGGPDNWDYRFNWIRDSSFTVQALTALGHFADANKFLSWLSEVIVANGKRPADLRVLYPLHRSSLIEEEELLHLRGYRDSKPVRIGNLASEQTQLDIYGEILETVFRSRDLHPDVDHELATVLKEIVEYVCHAWRNPDHSIWELRTDPKQYVYSKVMCWVAIDRGIRLANEYGWIADLERWSKERDVLREEILTRGYSEKHGSFMQSYESDVFDATSFLFPLLEFLPGDDPRVLSTLEKTKAALSDGALVYRTSEHRGKEGAFGLCSFWLVDALAFSGKLHDARDHFEILLSYANEIGLFSEEIDPLTKEFLGNFPQAFTHIGLINSALYLSKALGAASEKELMGEEKMA